MSRASTHPHPEIGAALRWLRLRAGLQQGQLAARMHERGPGISTTWLSQVENGHRRPSWSLVSRVLAELGADFVVVDELLARRPWAAAAGVQEGSEWADPVSAAPTAASAFMATGPPAPAGVAVEAPADAAGGEPARGGEAAAGGKPAHVFDAELAADLAALVADASRLRPDLRRRLVALARRMAEPGSAASNEPPG